MWARPATLDDHVVARDDIRVGIVGRISRGTRGIVVSGPTGVLAPRVCVEFDLGLGATATESVPVSALRVTRRGGGRESFDRGRTIRSVARWSCLVATLGPLLYFVIRYVAATGTTDGLGAALVTGMVGGLGDAVVYLVNDPVRAVIYLLVMSVVGRIAFR